MDRTPKEPPDPWGRPRDLYMEGFADGELHGCRHTGKLCIISAILGAFATVVGLVVAAAVMI